MDYDNDPPMPNPQAGDWQQRCIRVSSKLDRATQLLREAEEVTAFGFDEWQRWDQRRSALLSGLPEPTPEENPRAFTTRELERRGEEIERLKRELASVTAQLDKFKDWCANAKPARKTPHEQAVLDACANCGLGVYDDGTPVLSAGWLDIARAELALREAAK